MKKFLALILALCMLGAFMVACDNTPDNSDTDSDTSEPPVSETNDTEAPTDTETDVPTETETTPPVVTPSATKLQVGYAKVNITPTYSVPLAGDGSKRWSEDTDESTDIFATAIAFRDADGKLAVLITLDLLHTTNDSNQLYSNIMRRLKTVEGLSEENVIVSATHTHSAPDVFSGESVIRTKYNPQLYKDILQAVETAIEDLQETDVYVGSAEMTKMTFVRRYFAADGSFVGTQWDNDLPAVEHESEADNDIQIIKLVREDKNDILMVNWSAHLTTVQNRNALSGDFVYYMRKYVENNLKSDFAFFQGASGNTAPTSKIEGEDRGLDTESYGQTLGMLLGNAIKKDGALTQISSDASIKNNMTDLEVYYDRSAYDPNNAADAAKIAKAIEIAELFYTAQVGAGEANTLAREAGFSSVYECGKVRNLYKMSEGAEYVPFRLVAITIGDLSFGSAPYEMFCQNGMNIREGSEAKMTFVITHANGGHGYIASEDVFDNPGYETAVCGFAKDSATRIQNKLIEMINKNYN